MADNQRPGDTTRKGYGYKHQRIRRAWARVVAAGRVTCPRCGEMIQPHQPWDLGHVDNSDKARYSGPEHRACNRAAGSQVRQAGDPKPRPQTRW